MEFNVPRHYRDKVVVELNDPRRGPGKTAEEFSVPVLVPVRAAVANSFVLAAVTDRFDPIRFRPVPVRAAVVFSDPAMAIDRSGPIRVRLVPVRAAAGSNGGLVTAIGRTIVPVKSTIGTSGTIGARTITLASTTIGITTGAIMTTGSTTTGGAITTTLHWDYGDNFNCWGWAAWPAVTSWFPWGWNQPVYYSYGDNVYYQDDQVYYGTQPIATAEEYAMQAEAIATSVPDVQPAESDWMPLGVFAVTPDGEPTGADPTMYLQLAVSKQGIISGTYQNTATNVVESIEGMVDKQTQRAAWTVVGKTRPLMETGIVNLTEDSAPALVHFDDGTTQQWLLVRLEKPAASGATQTR